nr:GtrA family protein [Corynebacterium sp. ACRPQ]
MHFLETSGANALIGRAISYILGSLFAYYANSFVTFSGNRSTTEKLRALIVYTACLIMAVLVNSSPVSRWRISNTRFSSRG